MAATDKLKWQRLLNELRYVNEELQLTRTIIKDVAPDFEDHYRDFCIRNDIDRDQLNREHSERIQQVYDVPPIEEDDSILSEISASIDMPAMVPSPEASEVTPEQRSTEEPAVMTQDEKEMYEIFNKLFRKIALTLHPDKLPAALSTEEKERRIDDFNAAKQALSDRDYLPLLDIAAKYDIKTPRNYRQQARWMKKQIEVLKKDIGARQATYNYLFADAETEEEKDNIIRDFMRQLFRIKI